MESYNLAKNMAQFMLEKQAEDVLLLDLSKVSSLADYFLIATGSVDVHIKAIVDHVESSLASLSEPVYPVHIEGNTHYFWVLMDYGDVVVHVFSPEAREYYQLEKLWGDVPQEYIENTPEKSLE